MQKLGNELTAGDYRDGNFGFMFLFVDGFLELLRRWMNGYILLQEEGRNSIEKYEIYQLLSVVLFTDLVGIILDKSLDSLSHFDCNTPKVDRVSFIFHHLLAFPPTGLGDLVDEVWYRQRDDTQRLDMFENSAYEMTINFFLAPSHSFLTVDDDLYGSRSRDVPVKNFSTRKADKEGQSADAICDALFRVTLGVRFRRRGEGQTENLSLLLNNFVESRGRSSPFGMISTADRGYGSYSLLKTFAEFGIGTIMIMPEHYNRFHPFVGKSFLQASCENGEESSVEDEESVGSQTESDEN